jgi:hypothetical protein
MSIEEAFWAHVERRAPEECWPWKGCIRPDGYGQFNYSKRRFIASRLSWSLANGREAPGYVCHSCDNPPCVNPAHLWLGDVRSNTHDMLTKGRQRNQRKTHCVRGHAFTEANTYWFRGHRHCRACNAMHAAASKARRKAGDQ